MKAFHDFAHAGTYFSLFAVVVFPRPVALLIWLVAVFVFLISLLIRAIYWNPK